MGTTLQKAGNATFWGETDRAISSAGLRTVAVGGQLQDVAGVLRGVGTVATVASVGLTSLEIYSEVKSGDIAGAGISVARFEAGLLGSALGGSIAAGAGASALGIGLATGGAGIALGFAVGGLLRWEMPGMQKVFTSQAANIESTYGEKSRSGQMGFLDYLGLLGLSGGAQ